MNLKMSNLALCLILLLLIITRIPLYNPYGRYFFGDEIFYKRLINTSKESDKTNNPMLFWQGVFGIYAKPGYGILYSVPIWLESKNSIPYGAVMNIIINCLSILLFFLILKRVFDIKIAFVVALVVLFSISSIFYIRHMLPYDSALLILLLSLYILTRTKSLLLFGLTTALSLVIYPSLFYYILPIPFIIFVFNRFKIDKPIIYGVSFISVILFTQLLSLIIGAKPSYFEEAKYLSGIVTQGDFIPAINFLVEYILAYDGYWGLAIASLSPFLFIFRHNKNLFILAIYITFVFLLFEVFSHLIPKTVLYGRTIRPFYFLLLTGGTIVWFNLIRILSRKLNFNQNIFYAIFIAVTIINWFPKFNTFKNLDYPEDVRKEAEDYLSANNSGYILEDVFTKKETPQDNITDPPILARNKFYLVNPALIYPYHGNLEIPCDKEILWEKKHALSFRPYRYEGFTLEMRNMLEKEEPVYQLIHCK